MNWSNAALKLTLGVGSLAHTAVLSDTLDPVIGVWGIIGVIIVPLAIVAIIKPGEEIPARVVKILHGLAVAWYVALVIASVAVMAGRGFIATDALMGFMVVLGLVPCMAIVRSMMRGGYDDAAA